MRPNGPVLAHSQDALGGAEPVERVDLQQPVDHVAANWADLHGLGATPSRGPHMGGDLHEQAVAAMGAFSLFKGRMGLEQFSVVENLYGGLGWSGPRHTFRSASTEPKRSSWALPDRRCSPSRGTPDAGKGALRWRRREKKLRPPDLLGSLPLAARLGRTFTTDYSETV
jgi:hypothetical protein